MQQNRTQFTENQKLILYSEVGGVCPNCTNQLMYEKKTGNYKRFEIAHIYPLNPKKEEEECLKDEEKLDTDPNGLNNLICLCVDCHTIFDKPRSVDEYRDLVKKKKHLIQVNEVKKSWSNTTLEDEIFQVINYLSNEEFDFSGEDIINYDPKTIDKKTNRSITPLTKRTIKRNVEDYYSMLNNKFKELDETDPLTTETISTQIRSQYLVIKKQNPEMSQKDVFDSMVSWIRKLTDQDSNDASEVVVSYFVQNCEIFE